MVQARVLDKKVSDAKQNLAQLSGVARYKWPCNQTLCKRNALRRLQVDLLQRLEKGDAELLVAAFR
jgi:hypothetical protein